MFINEYSDKNNPLFLLLAPMMVSGEDLYQLMHPYFKHDYHYIAPDQGGHGKAGAYISADEEYKTLKSFLLDEGYREIELVYGASLGVAIGYRLFLDPDFTVHHAWFDGVALSRNAAVPEWFMKKVFRSRKKKLAKTKAEASPSLVQMYGYDFAKMMTKNFERITKRDNKTMIETGRCEVVQGDVSDLKLPADAFDLATAFETIYFWPGLEKCFAQVAKVLKPGGYFMICNESDGTDATGLKFEKIIDGMKNHTVEEIEAALRAAGFSEVTNDHHPSKHWITVLARK